MGLLPVSYDLGSSHYGRGPDTRLYRKVREPPLGLGVVVRAVHTTSSPTSMTISTLGEPFLKYIELITPLDILQCWRTFMV